MPPVTASAPAADRRRRARRPRPQRLLADYRQHLARTGRGNHAYDWAARSFLARWPDPQAWAAQPLARRLRAGNQTRPLLTFLMVHRWLRPGYDYLVERKLSSLWRELDASPLGPDLARFVAGAREAGFTERVASAVASQIIARLLIQTGRPLDALGHDDFEEFIDACRKRQLRTGRGWRHYRGAIHSARQVLFHLGVLDAPAPPLATAQPFVERMGRVSPLLRGSFVAYLQAKTATCRPKTVSSLATRLAHFGRFLAETDPHLASLADLDRRRHIEPFLAALTHTPNSKRDGLLSPADRARRVLAISTFLADITEWGWSDAPARRLVFKSDIPRLPHPLPRYIPPDADRRLAEALRTSPNRLAADALLLQRACGLRIGELLDLELDCVHEIPGQGAWLKVPLGKLDTERMVPLDDQSVAIVDRIVAHRSPGRPLPHPRTGRPADFLFTHHGRRLTQNPLRQELNRAAAEADLGHVTPHQLRHTYATALVNAGVSLQALMALLGHVSAEMSLRYGRLFDATVRTEYERALTLAKTHLGPLPQGRTNLPLADVTGGDWRDTPTIKARLAGGFCMRAPAQGACPYANICEHCPNFRTDTGYLPVLAAQRLDADTLARDAEARGWIAEADRHRRLLNRLDTLIAQAQAG
jgi:integrase